MSELQLDAEGVVTFLDPLDEHDDSAAHGAAHLAAVAPLLEPLEAKVAAGSRPRRLTPNEKKKARELMATYMARAIADRADKHYSQHRPMTHLGKSPDAEWDADCSGFDTGVYYWADKWLPFPIDDPNGLRYSGYGYTGTLLSHNWRHKVPEGRRYFVGDLALYGPPTATRHTTICRKPGNAATSVWGSFGNEAGPYDVRLHYRRDYLCVVRPWSLR